MNKTSSLIMSWSISTLLIIFFVALQTSVLRLGLSATAQLVLVFVTYNCLFREPPEALAFTFLSTFVLGSVSVVPQSAAVFAGIVMFLGLRLTRSFIYASDPNHFFWACMATILGFHIVIWIVTNSFDRGAGGFRILNWLIELGLTAFFVRIIFIFLLWTDQRTKRSFPSEIAG